VLHAPKFLDKVDSTDGVQYLREPYDLALSPDGEHLYVASYGSNAVVVLVLTAVQNCGAGRPNFAALGK